MLRKSLLAIWRNSQKQSRRPKGNSRVCRDDRCCSRCGSSSRKRDNAISRVSADNSASTCMPKLYAK
jgi:hypothetical protein